MQQMDKCVSVVMPTHNRAAFLNRTIPSYIQEGVAEVIVVDDCSTDHTKETVQALQEKYPCIQYLRNECNMLQPATKNRGMKYVTQPYIYFADDDSVLLPGTISFLLQAMRSCNADVMGAVPIYADCDADMENLPAVIKRKAPLTTNAMEYVDISHLEQVNFFFRMEQPVQVPFTHACALVKTGCIHSARFDVGLKGNAYREETDFFLQLGKLGAKIYFCASEHAAQINLPFAKIGRHRTLRSMWRHGKYDMINSLKLIDKHHAYFRTHWNYPHGKAYMKVSYVLNDLWMYARILPSRILSMIVKRLR